MKNNADAPAPDGQEDAAFSDNVTALPGKKDKRLHPAADVSKSVRYGMAALLLVFGGLGLWAALAPLSGAVVAPGEIKLDSNRKTVQHLEGGIVKDILVDDGDYVEAGEPLVIIEDESVTAQADMLQGQLDTQLIKAARLEAERNTEDSITYPPELMERADQPDVAKRMRTENLYFESRRQTLDEQVDLLRQQADEAEREVEGLEAQLKAGQEAINYLTQEVEANEDLAKKQFIQKSRILELKRTAEDYRVRVGEYRADLSQTRQKVLNLQLRIVELRNQYRQQATEELTAVNDRIFELQERLRPILDARRRLDVTAPISGTVVDMQIHTKGGVIRSGEKLMDIVQKDGDLIVEARLNVDVIDDVKVGQEADVRLTAYPRRTTPLIVGNVSYVSADSLEDERTGQRYYLTRIDLDPDSLADAGENIKLYPGMPAEVYIKTGQRTALDYLLAPVENTLRRSFREP